MGGKQTLACPEKFRWRALPGAANGEQKRVDRHQRRDVNSQSFTAQYREEKP
jgi:hypothetical protein